MSAPGRLDVFYGAVVDALDVIEGTGHVVFAKAGDVFALVGAHSPTGLCWCQPTLERETCANGHEHVQITHKRVMDMDDDEYDELHDGHWVTSEEGVIWPTLQARRDPPVSGVALLL